MGKVTDESVPDDIEEEERENKIDSMLRNEHIQKYNSDSSSRSTLPPDAPLTLAGIYTQSLNNTVSDLYTQASDKVDGQQGEGEELDYEPFELDKADGGEDEDTKVGRQQLQHQQQVPAKSEVLPATSAANEKPMPQ